MMSMRNLVLGLLVAGIVLNAAWVYGEGENMSGEQPAAASVPPVPSIVCDEPVYNFGTVANTGHVEHTFLIRNAGEVTLEIRNVRASCGCTATAISKYMIEPGQTAEIVAKLDLRGRQGRQYKTIFVDTNDPRTPTLTLAFEGTAQPDFRVQPRQIFFGRIGAQAVVTGTIELATSSGQWLNVKRVDSGNPHLTAVVIGEPPHLEVEIKTLPPMPKGPFHSRVVIETDHPSEPVTEILVTAFVVGDVTFAPTELVLREDPDVRTTRYILLRSETDQPFQILSVATPQPDIEANVQPTGPAAYRVEIRNIQATRDLNGQVIKLSTTLPESKEIVVPFRILPANP